MPATGWSYLDLYLMGLIGPGEVPDFFILRNLAAQGRDANGHPIFKADRTKITVQDVIAVEGPREPDVDHAQKALQYGNGGGGRARAQAAAGADKNVEGIRERWIDYLDGPPQQAIALT